jgi:hypothetical protein
MHQLASLVVSIQRASSDLQQSKTTTNSYSSFTILVARQGPAEVVIPVFIPLTPLDQSNF